MLLEHFYMPVLTIIFFTCSLTSTNALFHLSPARISSIVPHHYYRFLHAATISNLMASCHLLSLSIVTGYSYNMTTYLYAECKVYSPILHLWKRCTQATYMRLFLLVRVSLEVFTSSCIGLFQKTNIISIHIRCFLMTSMIHSHYMNSFTFWLHNMIVHCEYIK